MTPDHDPRAQVAVVGTGRWIAAARAFETADRNRDPCPDRNAHGNAHRPSNSGSDRERRPHPNRPTERYTRRNALTETGNSPVRASPGPAAVSASGIQGRDSVGTSSHVARQSGAR
jgi:hypothetical protein